MFLVMSFGKWIREKRKAAGLTQDTLAESVMAHGVKMSAGYISNLERDYYKNQDGQPSRPSERIVDAIAKALGCPLDEARLAAGYAPKTSTRKPETIPELVEALERLGIEAPQPFGGYPQDPDGEGYKEVVERIWLDIQLVTNRLQKGFHKPTISELEIAEIDIESDARRTG